jgi:hypothetical protein
MTEDDPGVQSEKPPTTPLVNRDPPLQVAPAWGPGATRWARRLGVQSDVGELCFALRSVRNREATLAPNQFCLAWPLHWLACRVQLRSKSVLMRTPLESLSLESLVIKVDSPMEQTNPGSPKVEGQVSND